MVSTALKQNACQADKRCEFSALGENHAAPQPAIKAAAACRTRQIFPCEPSLATIH
jgi:hypothetical protein